MKNSIITIFLALILLACTSPTIKSTPTQIKASSDTISNKNTNVSQEATGVVRKIDSKTFSDEIFDYKSNPTTWLYKGYKPAIVDFYAEWCGPCKRIAPIMDELAAKYKGQVSFYKIDTDKNPELSSFFAIRSIPSILFIPAEGQPNMTTGAASKEDYIDYIETNFILK